jgi:hypothetical protein
MLPKPLKFYRHSWAHILAMHQLTKPVIFVA